MKILQLPHKTVNSNISYKCSGHFQPITIHGTTRGAGAHLVPFSEAQ